MSEPLIGATVAHFRLLAELGRGGMGVVYRAEDLTLRREVAIKMLPPEVAADPERKKRLLREARSAAAVSHANIATIYQVGEDERGTFIAMELIRGVTLREALASGLSRTRALSIGMGIARGLARAHESGVLHRDLKPENVMIDREGEPKILDFGLARSPRDEERTSAPDVATIEGRVVGTPGYMSPEQARGAQLDARSDVFALGVVLYELLSGARAFAGETPMDAILAVLRTRPPRLRGVGEDVASIVERCLEPVAARRYADAGEVRDALAALAGAHVASLFEVRAGIESAPTMHVSAGATAVPHTVEQRALAEHDRAFLGRERELGEVIARFASGARRITLVGPGGIGKTRLAQRVAESLRDRDGTRTFAASLAGARTRADVVSRVAESLGVAIAGASEADAAIATALGARGAVLLVIDEAESAARDLAELLPAWLAGTPSARALVTSRERLRSRSEEVIEVGPLDVEAGATLFLARAADARAQITIDDAVRETARAIAERLEGSPLAIELAAARAEVLSPAAILARLDDRMKLLRRRGEEDRHASLRAVIEWSWSLLDEAERGAAAQLSAFVSGFEADAAEAVLALGDDVFALDVVQSLRDKSLLRAAASDSSGVRFVLYEAVRLFAWQVLSEDEAELRATLSRHAAYFSDRALRAEDRAREEGDAASERWLVREQGELIAVADRALDGAGPSVVQGASALAAIARVASARGGEPVAERLGALLARADALPDDVAAQARAGLAVLLSATEPRRAAAEAARAVELARRAADPRVLGRAAAALARTALLEADVELVERAATEAAAIGRRVGSADLVERGLHMLAARAWRSGRADEGLPFVREAIASAEARGASDALPDLWILEGILLDQRGDHERAEACNLRALEAARAAGRSATVGTLLVNLGVSAHGRGDLVRARERLEEAIHVLGRRGMSLMLAIARGNLGVVDGEEGAFAIGRARLDETIARLEAIGERRYRAAYLSARAGLAADQDEVAEAERDLELAQRLADEVGEDAIRAVVEVCRGRVDLARARAASDPDERALHRAAMEARVATARAIAATDVVHLAIRLLRAAEERSARALG